MPAKESQKEVTRLTTLKRKRQKGHCNFCSLGCVLKILVALFADARVSGKRAGRLQILNDRAEIDRLGIECLVFCDLRPIQNPEPIAFEHFFAAPAFERDDLTAHAFFAGAIQITQIRTHERARSRNFSRLRQKVDVKMWDVPWLSGNFVPPVHQNPSNKEPRSRFITEVAGQRPEEKPDILVEHIELAL